MNINTNIMTSITEALSHTYYYQGQEESLFANDATQNEEMSEYNFSICFDKVFVKQSLSDYDMENLNTDDLMTISDIPSQDTMYDTPMNVSEEETQSATYDQQRNISHIQHLNTLLTKEDMMNEDRLKIINEQERILAEMIKKVQAQINVQK